MGILGGKSGFKTARDLILFTIGAALLITHVVFTIRDPDKLNIPFLMFCGGVMGAPYVLSKSNGNGDKK